MSEWITDRMPTAEDCHAGCDDVWVYDENYKIVVRGIRQSVWRGLPWQPIQAPDPYVKPKRWTVCKDSNGWNLNDGYTTRYFLPTDCSDAAAQRICDIYNEEMP